MDDDVLGVLVLVVCRAKEGKILVCQKEGWIERNGIVQGGVLSTGGRAHGGEKPAADAEFGKGPKPGPLVGLVTADGCQQAQHPLLD